MITVCLHKLKLLGSYFIAMV